MARPISESVYGNRQARLRDGRCETAVQRRAQQIALALIDRALANGYRETQSVQNGDLALFTRDGQVQHSGIVRRDATGAVLIESKWGPLGVYLHGIETHPFAKQCALYRSPRSGHLLSIMARTAAVSAGH
jgi:hypothetical protein